MSTATARSIAIPSSPTTDFALRPGNLSDMFDLWVTTRSKLKRPD